MADGQEVVMRVEVAWQALATLDKLAAVIDKIAEAEKKAAEAALKWRNNMGGPGGGGGRGGSGGGGGGGGGGRGSGGGGKSKSQRTIDEEVDDRLKRRRREDRIKAEMERRNPTPPKLPKPPKPKKTIDEEAQDAKKRRSRREQVNARSRKSIDEEAQDQVDKRKRRDQINAKAKLLTPPGPPKPGPNAVIDAQEKLKRMDHQARVKEEMELLRPTPPKHVKSFDEEVNSAVASERKRNALQKAVDKKMGRGGMMGNVTQALQGGSGGMGGMLQGLGKLGAVGALAAAALVAFHAGLKKATDIVNIENDGTKTRAQKDRGIVEAVVPFAESIRKFREAVDGTTEAIAANKRKLDREVVSIGAGTVYDTKKFNFQADANLAGARLNALAEPGAATGSMDTFNRGTAIGARKAAEQDITLPAYDERRRAGTEARAQRINADQLAGAARFAAADTKKLKDDAIAKADKARTLRENENKPGASVNKKEIDTAFTEARIANERYMKAQEQEEAKILRAKEAGVAAANAESAARKASITAAKAELEVLKQREERMAGMASKLGSMNQADFEMSKAMLQNVKENGIENMPAEMVDMAAQVAPEFIAKQREALGEKRAKEVAGENKGIDDSILAEFEKGTLGEVRAQVDKVKADVRIMIDLDVQQLAQEVVNTINPLFKMFFDSIRGEMLGKMREYDLAQGQSHNVAQ